MNNDTLPQDQLQQYKKRCADKGLHPDGFDLRCEPDAAGLGNILIKLGRREYRYAMMDHDYRWIDRFFHDINQVGDPGNNIAIVDEDKRGDVSRHAGLQSAKEHH